MVVSGLENAQSSGSAPACRQAAARGRTRPRPGNTGALTVGLVL